MQIKSVLTEQVLITKCVHCDMEYNLLEREEVKIDGVCTAICPDCAEAVLDKCEHCGNHVERDELADMEVWNGFKQTYQDWCLDCRTEQWASEEAEREWAEDAEFEERRLFG